VLSRALAVMGCSTCCDGCTASGAALAGCSSLRIPSVSVDYFFSQSEVVLAVCLACYISILICLAPDVWTRLVSARDQCSCRWRA